MLITAGLIHTLPLADRLGISRKEAADIWGCSPTFFDKLVREGTAPKPVTFHGRKIWHRIEVQKAFDAQFGLEGSRSWTNSWDDILQ